MEDRILERIHVRDLLLRCVIGVNAWERVGRQDVRVSLTLHADLGEACRTDDLGQTVDYATLTREVTDAVEASGCLLVEALAQKVADVCLAHERVQRVDVIVEKPGALRSAQSVDVEITRTRTC